MNGKLSQKNPGLVFYENFWAMNIYEKGRSLKILLSCYITISDMLCYSFGQFCPSSYITIGFNFFPKGWKNGWKDGCSVAWIKNYRLPTILTSIEYLEELKESLVILPQRKRWFSSCISVFQTATWWEMANIVNLSRGKQSSHELSWN